jgi:hypothetical protein
VTALTVVKGGISRERTKGAANPQVLFDLVNGYVTDENTVTVRPGTFRRATLDATTKGLVAFDGTKHVFAAEEVAVPSGYTLHILQHPAGVDDYGAQIPIKQIHFAKPMMGFLYVVAEFDNDGGSGLGTVFHYWLETGPEWSANTAYKLGDVVTPTTPNGFAYRATRASPPSQSWRPNVVREIGDVVEPTVYNDFYYTVVETEGDTPKSGTTEPAWPTKDGAQVFEDSADTFDGLLNTTTQPDPNTTTSTNTQDRYGGPGQQELP